MHKIAYRSITPFEGSGKGNMVTAVPVFGGTPLFQDIIDAHEDIRSNDIHGRGDWGAGEDEDPYYREDAGDYKLQERLREVLERLKQRGPRERWDATDEDGKTHRFDSLEHSQHHGREIGKGWKTVTRMAKVAQSQEDDQRTMYVATALQACAMVESVPRDGQAELGSAFSIGNGRFITCAHVVKRYDRAKMPPPFDEHISRLTLHQFGRSYPASLVQVDLNLDIAILQSKAPLPALTLGRSETLSIGAPVFAVGSPKGYENNVSAGILSSKHRRLPWPNSSTYLFTDAQILPGSSGGPLISELDGTVVGVISLIVAGGVGMYGLNAALPIEPVTNLLKGVTNLLKGNPVL